MFFGDQSPPSVPQMSREAARQLIEKIAVGHGQIAEATMDAMPPDVRRIVEEALKMKYASQNIATQLALTFERIPVHSANVSLDDNQYTRAKAASVGPGVQFLITQDLVIIGSNEDGFTENNVKALCDFGKSTKHDILGYIGQPDIGFKSVFTIASKVQIESGPFTFYFQHDDGETGVGIASPHWTEPIVLPDDVKVHEAFGGLFGNQTRIILFLKRQNTDSLRNGFISQLWDTPESVLLFMKNLQSFKITILDKNGEIQRSKDVRLEKDMFGSGIRISTSKRIGPVQDKTWHRYLIYKSTATGLDSNTNRTSTPDSTNSSSAEVVLAFPVDEKGEPVVEVQKAFAFMPLSDSGFSFLVHSDFVTDVKRQRIIYTSERNLGLKRALAKAVATAIQDLCKKPGLEHKWMRFLPQVSWDSTDPFWQGFDNLIRSHILEFPILPPRSQKLGSLFRIPFLKRLSAEQMDQRGVPLLPDLEDEMYLSTGYENQDLDILSQYGLTYMPNWAIISRLSAYTQSGDWRKRTFDSRDEDWHSRMASMILKMWNDNGNDLKSAIRHMDLIPLASRKIEQVSLPGATRSFYSPIIGGILIPDDLDYPMVFPAAVANPDCRKLYEALGMQSLTFQQVREKIISIYRATSEVAKLSIAMSRNHLVFLYRMEPIDMINKYEQEFMVIFDQRERIRHPKHEYVYLPGDGDWSPGNLLYPPYSDGIEDPDVSLIHPIYLENQPSPSVGNGKSWMEWLFHCVYCEERIQMFTTRDPPAEADKIFSPEYRYITRTSPGRALQRLLENFQSPDLKKLWLEDRKGSALMRKMEFLCTDNVRRPLEEALLPLPQLLKRCLNFASMESMPFLKLDEPMKVDDMSAWVSCAQHFGVGVEEDTRFTLAMLNSISTTVTEITNQVSEVVIGLYLELQKKAIDAPFQQFTDIQSQIKSFFMADGRILCTPLYSHERSKEARWARTSSCLWNAPQGINAYVPLGSIWKPIIEEMDTEAGRSLEAFFRQTLLVRDMTYHDILTELSQLSFSVDLDKDYSITVKELYMILQAQTKTFDQADTLVIQNCPLIYIPHHATQKWYKLSECIWSSDGTTEKEIGLEVIYPDFHHLFVPFLSLPKMGASITCQRLLDIKQIVHPVSEIKTLLWSLLETLIANPELSDVSVERIRACRIFPVRAPNGTVHPMPIHENFSINDRPAYWAVLKDKISFLDFSVEEVYRLKPVIQWLRLTDRYISKTAKEESSIDENHGSKDIDMTLDITSKAAAFANIAMHFSDGYPTVRSCTLQETIRKVEVFRHPSIKCSVSWSSGFKSLTTPLQRSGMHFKLGRDSRWQFFLPQNEEERDFCLAAELPRLFAAQILDCSSADVNLEAVMITASVLQAKPYNVGRILQHHGIYNFIALNGGTSGPPKTPERQRENAAPSPSSSPGCVVMPYSVPAVSPAQVMREANTPYQALLIQTVNVARVSTFPDKSTTFDLTSIEQSLAESTNRTGLFRFYVGDQTEWQRMVGAAGELFVFELLSSIPHSLPGWSRDNWQSTVRHHASIHPDYTSLGRWYGREQSDLFFDDKLGSFTSYLIQKGYLEENWRKERPEYYIEVKTTTSSRLDTSFYMSKHQYARMQSFDTDSGTAVERRKVFLLFRVHGLESGQIGVRIYADLEGLRKTGDLVFEAVSWTITPRMGA
ncbi:hypothetical protein FHETE_2546 [Fusarium heterosporum]|uniref:Protein NO VEIN C-terminal domain-containing protein n=1 Tax=Fusarium heterosporum TaxID=42747 RepID=A0A8H5TNN6_FUSHE|nr:hypothetical protein FHETE_2546 [Fusarium heterosporum]